MKMACLPLVDLRKYDNPEMTVKLNDEHYKIRKENNLFRIVYFEPRLAESRTVGAVGHF